MRWEVWSRASQTMVMRETSVRSDSPTVRETMLMLRRRKSEATRVRTPGLSWTRATKVWSMGTFLTMPYSIRYGGGQEVQESSWAFKNDYFARFRRRVGLSADVWSGETRRENVRDRILDFPRVG